MLRELNKIFKTNHLIRNRGGFTLVEVLIGTFILIVVLLGVYQAISSVATLVRAARVKIDATMLANEQIEIARNLAYQDVGIIAGVPAGKIPRTQTVVRDGFTFNIVSSVRNIDDPFDGQAGSSTYNDLAPGDYKQLEIDLSCANCPTDVFTSQVFVTTISPRNLETSTGNGSLFIKVFNGNGDPVSGASVQIVNTSGASPINISETTNNSGIFQLVDTPPGSLAYRVSVTKAGYSSDNTVSASADNPNPLKPPATVVASQATQLSFVIDRLSRLKVYTKNVACTSLPGANFNLRGEKKIGQDPDVYKYDNNLISDSSGFIDLPNLEWDTYNFSIAASSSYSLAGTLPLTPANLSPGATQEVSLLLAPRSDRGLLVAITDAATGLPLSGAQITLGSRTFLSSQGYFSQTDWSGGSGQEVYTNKTMYAESDGNLDTLSVPGEVLLRSSFGQYLSAGYLISSVYDTRGTSTVYSLVNWEPSDQATSTGVGSIKLQIASSNDQATSTWNFRGPDGTAGTFYSTPNTAIHAIHNGDEFVRYKLYLSTANGEATPNVSDISLTYSTACTPPGQAYFDGLAGDLQTISVSRAGYSPFSGNINTTNAWQMVTIPLSVQ